MTTCIHMKTLPMMGGDETVDICTLSDKLCLLVSTDQCEAQEQEEGE